MAIEQIRILRVQGRAEGMELVTAALEKVAGATVKVTMASDGMVAATTTQTSKVLSLSKQWDTYQARTDLAARAQQQFARDITSLTRFYEQGTIGASKYADEIDRVKNSLTAAGTQSGVPKVDQSGINASLGISNSIENSAKEAAATFQAEFDRLETIAVEKSKHIAAVTQQGIAEAFGVNSIAKSAQQSAAAFAAELDRMDELTQQKAVQIGRNFQEELNRGFGIGGAGAKSAGATFSALEEQMNQLDAIATAKAAHIGQVFKENLNASFGIGSIAKSARDSAEAFELVARAEDAAAAKASALRAAINPLDAEFVRLGKDMAEYRALMNAGHISADEFGQAQLLAGKRLSDFERNLKNGANAGRVMSGELVNLSYQLNDVVTGLALGQSPFMIIAQQGGQVFQIFQNSKASVVDFAKEAGSKLLGTLTVGRLVFGGIASAIGVAVFALNSYLDAQNRVAMGLTGAGRASGASMGSINQTADAGSSMTGLSVSEARNLATALASTGKVANDNILPIVKMGKDIAKAFGTDAAGATELLAKSFADPVKGAEDLNARLGFMDASMQRQIANLVAQNRLWDAQKVLTAGVSSSLADVNAAVTTSSKFWTALGNIISNAFDKVGEGAARVTGIGLKLGLDEQIENSKKRVLELEAIASRRSDAVNKNTGTTGRLEKERANLDELTAAAARYGQATVDAQQRQFSFAQAAGVRNQQPAIEQLEKLRNEQELLVKALIDVQTSGGPASEVLKRMGVTYEQLGAAVAVATGNLTTFKTEFQSQADSLKIANDAITAFSPSAKGDIARRQSIESTNKSTMTPAEKAALAEQAYTNAVKQSTTALSEAARQRALTGNQAVASARLEETLFGKTIGQQVEMRANLQARQQLEQEASQNRTGFDTAQFERLKKINAELAKQAQLNALASIRNDISFGSRTSMLSPDDVAIAQQLKGVYPDVATALASVEAAGLQTNAAISGLSSSFSGSFTTGLADIADGTKSVSAGFADLQKVVIRSIEEMIIKLTVVIPLMRALQMGASFLGGGLFGGSTGTVSGAVGPTSLGGAPLVASANGNVFSAGNVIPFAKGGVVRTPTMFPMANGGTGIAGEVPGSEEGILPLTRIHGKLGVHAVGGGGNAPSGVPNVTIINQTGTPVQGEATQAPNGDMTITLKKMVIDTVNESVASGDVGRTIGQKFGLKQFTGT